MNLLACRLSSAQLRHPQLLDQVMTGQLAVLVEIAATVQFNPFPLRSCIRASNKSYPKIVKASGTFG